MFTLAVLSETNLRPVPGDWKYQTNKQTNKQKDKKAKTKQKKKQQQQQNKTKQKQKKQNKKGPRSTNLPLTALFFTLQQPSSFKMTAAEMASRTVFPPGP